MIKKLLATALIGSTLFSYEVSLSKPATTQVKAPQSEFKVRLVRDDSKEVVCDTITGLMWQDNIDTKTIKKIVKMPKDTVAVWFLLDIKIGTYQK